MKTKKEITYLREHCNNVRQKKENEGEKERIQRREEVVKQILEYWLNKTFGYGNKPWRAIEGKKKLRPIPIKLYYCNKEWPNDVSKDFIIKVIKSLGFTVKNSLNGTDIVLTIPKCKKGEKLTWAQEKIRKLNHDYSVYVNDEKAMAQFLFREMLVELSNYDIDKTKVYDDHILFENYIFGETMGLESKVRISKECYKFIQRLKRKNKIDDYFVDGDCLGIQVFDTK